MFHAPILEPYLDLSLRQSQMMRYLDAPPASQVFVVVELLLEFKCLKARVSLSASFSFYFRATMIDID